MFCPAPSRSRTVPIALTLHLTALDTVGLAFSALEFAKTEPDRVVVGRPQGVGRPARQPGHLPDGAAQGPRGRRQGGEVQIRSQSPTPRDEERGYYEMRLFRQGSLRMERFAFDETPRQRRRVPCQLTREVLERLADDIAASVG